MTSPRIEREEDVLTAVRRIADQWLTEALQELEPVGTGHGYASPSACVRSCERVGALLRLVRPSLGKQYRPANKRCREAIRSLQPWSRPERLRRAFEGLVAREGDGLAGGTIDAVRRGLEGLDPSIPQSAENGSATEAIKHVRRAGKQLTRAQDAVAELTLADGGWDALSGGLARSYGDGADALEATIKKPRPARFAALRRRTAYVGAQVRLLEPTSPSLLGPLADGFDELSLGLADAVDLAELRAELTANAGTYGGDAGVNAVCIRLDRHRMMLERVCIGLAARLYAESPKRFAARLGGYWESWQAYGEEQRVDALTADSSQHEVTAREPEPDGSEPVAASEPEPADEEFDDAEADAVAPEPEPVAERLNGDVTSVELGESSVVRLRELAQQAELPGRSKMRRADLIEALTTHRAAT